MAQKTNCVYCIQNEEQWRMLNKEKKCSAKRVDKSLSSVSLTKEKVQEGGRAIGSGSR